MSVRRGFTLIEAIVVMAIIGILTSLTLSAVQKVRAASARMVCANNLRQIGLALHHYHDSQRALPSGCSYRDGKDPQPFMRWCARLLPFLERDALWRDALRAYETDPFFRDNPPHTGFGTVVPTFTCPTDARTSEPWVTKQYTVAFTAYLGVEGTNQARRDGVLFLDSRVRLTDVTDGTSNTIAVGERPPSANHHLGWWYAGWGQSKDGSGDSVLGVREVILGPYGGGEGCSSAPYPFRVGRIDDQCDAFHFWSLHPGGANFLFCDGSVRFLSYSADPIMPALATRAGGEHVSVPE